jgi:hypothetical protein
MYLVIRHDTLHTMTGRAIITYTLAIILEVCNTCTKGVVICVE